MGWMDSIKSLWRSPAEPAGPSNEEREIEHLEKLRRWESAETTRLNYDRWSGVTGNPINFDLMQDWQTLVARCVYERMNNPMVEGVCETFATDVLGRRGPHLIVESEDGEYNDAVEGVWNQWFSRCCVDGTSGVDLLFRLIGQNFDKGEWLQQLINLEDELPSSDPVKMRLLDIDPCRLWDPFGGTRNSIMGVQRDSLGRPVKYWIRNDVQPNQLYQTTKYKDVAAEDILHCFQSREPGQVRGVPRLASVLQELADLRDYDAQVLDAARTAANNAMVLTTRDPTLVGEKAKALPAGSSIQLQRQQATYVAPGYEATQMHPSQPGAHYIEFRHEKLRSLGRCAHMPLLMVLLSAEDSNFSQSRIDLNVIYQRGVNRFQNWIETNWLEPLRKMVIAEAGLAFAPGMTANDPQPFLVPKAPGRVNFRWGWEPIAQANPKDHVKVQLEKINLGLSAPAIELASEGLDEEFVLASLHRTQQRRAALGLPPLPLSSSPQMGQAAEQTEPPNDPTDDSDDEKEAPKPKAKRTAGSGSVG